ncbi:glycosyltransferase family 2 protein [Patescibacteria group bacterium]|nr:glycosyltransferase family 2 protein [Patescibacteria group bacterium]MBU1931924.1 glycosyltransferase family 2 protein [Patescibacteria group bacterium]
MAEKLISVIIPCYNEEKNILPMYQRLKKVFSGLKNYQYQIIYVNNGSIDNSEAIFKKLAAKDKQVVIISLSRNFYKSQGAYTAGMDFATGEAAVLLDGDIQDPPEVIPRFIKKWQQGFNIVYGQRIKRAEGVFKKFCYKLFYRLFKKAAYIDIPLDAGDFSLIDKQVLKIMNSMPERDRYIRGLRAWVGFKHAAVKYRRQARKHGETTNSFVDNLRWVSLAIFSFSYLPLEFISWLAFIVVGISLVAIVGYTVSYFIFPPLNPRGFLTALIATLFLGGIQLLSLSIIGQYLGRMFEEIKARPKYIVREVLNNPC